MTIALTGATGFVGRHAARALLAAGHSVRALVREREKARKTLPAGVAWVFGEIGHRDALNELMQGCDAIVHCVGIRREFPPDITFESAHTRATLATTEAAKNRGVRRFIHISALGTRPNAPTAYHRSKYEAETIVRQSGLEWTILRPALIHGPDGEFIQMAKAWALGRSAPYFFMPYFARATPPSGFPPVPKPESARLQPVHVDDVAAAIVASLANPAAVGEVYSLVGPEVLDWPGVLAAIRDNLPLSDGKKRIVPLPGAIAAAGALAAGAVGLGAALPFGPSEPIMAMEEGTSADDKVRQHLGLNARAFTRSFIQYAAEA